MSNAIGLKPLTTNWDAAAELLDKQYDIIRYNYNACFSSSDVIISLKLSFDVVNEVNHIRNCTSFTHGLLWTVVNIQWCLHCLYVAAYITMHCCDMWTIILKTVKLKIVKLKIVKNYLRSTMSEERLSDLAQSRSFSRKWTCQKMTVQKWRIFLRNRRCYVVLDYSIDSECMDGHLLEVST